jgi:endonuclease/exonuclease/phosphatase family metal-dependent hydrolase
VRRIAEHVLISRHPILSAAQASREPITRRGSEWWYQPGVRFVVDFEGREVVIWSVHLRSPRDHFRQLRGAFLWTLGWNRPGEPFPGLARGDLETYWIEHRKTVEALKELMEAETLPTLVLGDWNVPDVGPLYQRVSAGFSDAHREAGAGYGYTFPGDLEWWAAFGQPWLRIDYVLSDRHWRPRRCEVEPASGGAQHLALFAELELQ